MATDDDDDDWVKSTSAYLWLRCHRRGESSLIDRSTFFFGFGSCLTFLRTAFRLLPIAVQFVEMPVAGGAVRAN